MNSEKTEHGQKNTALWVTVIVEAIMIVVVGAYNIHEVRRSSELVQKKIQGLAEYSAHQGEKLDRMTTALELYAGKRFSSDDSSPTDQRVEKMIEFLEAGKKKDGKVQPYGASNHRGPVSPR